MQVKTIFLPTEKSMTLETCAPLIATLPLEVDTAIYSVKLRIEMTFVLDICACIIRIIFIEL